jgi:hypothetical protein
MKALSRVPFQYVGSWFQNIVGMIFLWSCVIDISDILLPRSKRSVRRRSLMMRLKRKRRKKRKR